MINKNYNTVVPVLPQENFLFVFQRRILLSLGDKAEDIYSLPALCLLGGYGISPPPIEVGDIFFRVMVVRINMGDESLLWEESVAISVSN